MASEYWVLAFYHLEPIADPHQEVLRQKLFIEGRDIRCRNYFSEQGINGQMSASPADAQAYMAWMHEQEEFRSIEFKIHTHHEHAFPRQSVRYRAQLVAVDQEVDFSKRATAVSPQEWKDMLKSGEYVLIDVRNDYETEIGHFEGSLCPPLKSFREFPQYAKELKEKFDPKKTKIMMCCTGGIRCEFYSPIMREEGFEQLYQLDGGIIKYGQECGNEGWKGKLFVFDDRLAVPLANEEPETIATCHHCHKPCDTYYNCANMDCNTLFVACDACLESLKGCCVESCLEAPRQRPWIPEEAYKPFRRKHVYRGMLSHATPRKSSTPA